MVSTGGQLAFGIGESVHKTLWDESRRLVADWGDLNVDETHWDCLRLYVLCYKKVCRRRRFFL